MMSLSLVRFALASLRSESVCRPLLDLSQLLSLNQMFGSFCWQAPLYRSVGDRKNNEQEGKSPFADWALWDGRWPQSWPQQDMRSRCGTAAPGSTLTA